MDKSRFAVYNPYNKPIEDLPFIFGFNNGGDPEFLYALLLAADGTHLGSHMCSSEGFMYGDLGILEGHRHDRHEGFKQHYPDGYRMDFVPLEQVKSHPGLQEAYRLNQILAKKHKEEQERKANDSSTDKGSSQTNPEAVQA